MLIWSVRDECAELTGLTGVPERRQTGARPQDREVLVVGEQHLVLAGAGH